MWIMFLLAFVVMSAVLYLPGFLVIRSTGLSRIDSVCCAPLISVAAYAILAIVYQKIGIASSFLSLICPVTLLGAVMLAFALGRGGLTPPSRARVSGEGCEKSPIQPDSVEWGMLAVYILVGLVAVTWVFVKNLDGPSSFLQEYDNWYHLGAVRSFIETGNYSSLSPSIYADWRLRGLVEPYMTTAGFYPSAWHGIVAMTASLLHVPVTLGVNALNAVLAGIACPLGAFRLLGTLFGDKRSLRWLGAIGSVAFVAFPWYYVEYGPLYPNLLSSVLVLPCMACFMDLFKDGASARGRIVRGVIFAVGSMAVALSQPNGIFTMAVVLAPFCIYQTGRIASDYLQARFAVYAVQVIAALCIAAIWVFCFRLPSFQDLVSFNWVSYESLHQAVASAFFLSTDIEPAQPFLALCVLVGFVWVLSQRTYRWIAASYLLTFVSYCVATSSEGFFKHLLTGFWYTDPRRLAVNMAIAGLPLAVLGLRCAYIWLTRVFLKLVSFDSEDERNNRYAGALVGMLGVIAIIVLIFYPNYVVKGHLKLTTAFGSLTDHIVAQNDQSRENNILNPEERAFAERALAITGKDAPIINTPNDGSCFLYGIDDMNMMYRFFFVQDESRETDASRLIRTRLNEVATDGDVQAAVASYGARYVLVLDQGDGDERTRRFVGNYNPAQWEGILSITDDTPGFKTVLSEGDMRLYEIVA